MTNDQYNSKAAEQYIDQMSGTLKQFKKVPMTVYVLKKQFTAYEITYKNDDDSNGYEIVAYGIVNNQPVLVQLLLKRRPKSNDDVPDFAQQIITIVPNS